jgi:hypothetical protein
VCHFVFLMIISFSPSFPPVCLEQIFCFVGAMAFWASKWSARANLVSKMIKIKWARAGGGEGGGVRERERERERESFVRNCS